MTHEHDDTRAPNQGESDPLDETRGLPQAIEPERDLWPGIAARLERPQPAPRPIRRPERSSGRGWRLWQLAAAAALVAVLGGTAFGLWWLLGPEGSGDPLRATGPATAVPGDPAPAVAAGPDGTEPEGSVVPGAGAFGSRLMAALDRKRNQLGPETSDAVEADIARLGMAMAEILTALGDHPDDPSLYQHLAARQRQEADLLLRLDQL